MAGFKKRIIEHGYTQNIKAPGLMVSVRRFLDGFPIVSMWQLMSPGLGPF